MKEISEILKGREFLDIATCDFNGKPNVAPKFLLKFNKKFIYLVDHVMGASFRNLKANPQVSISVMDIDTLTGYQLNGSVEIVTEGLEYEEILQELADKKIKLSVERIIEAVGKNKKHACYELMLPDKFAVFKVMIEEAVEINLSGKLNREKL
ncbi:MAG: pyridoxamine 5'-phosphate oxidase family protein [Candidatus Omnitrophota bacterium]